MKAIILAAGYATRLYPLTLNCPKPLLDVAGAPMLDYVMRCIHGIKEIDDVIIVTNERFASNFEDWTQKTSFRFSGKRPIVINDHTTNNENRLGAIGDVKYVLAQLDIKDDILILAGDNLFSEPLESFGEWGQKLKSPLIALYDVKNLELVKKYSTVSIDDQGIVTDFEEKPQNPQTTLTAIALYYYPASILPYFKQYTDEGNNPDQPGRFVQWLCKKVKVHTWQVPGWWLDIGSKECLDEASRLLTERK